MRGAIAGLNLVLLALGLTAAACGGGGNGPEGSSPEDGASAAAVMMAADDFSFEPKAISAEAGNAVTVVVQNEGNASHTFTIDELNVDVSLSPGEKETISFTPSEGGTLAFYCRFHRASGMEGAVTVSGDSSGAAPGEGTPGQSGDAGDPGYGY